MWPGWPSGASGCWKLIRDPFAATSSGARPGSRRRGREGAAGSNTPWVWVRNNPRWGIFQPLRGRCRIWRGGEGGKVLLEAARGLNSCRKDHTNAAGIASRYRWCGGGSTASRRSPFFYYLILNKENK